MQDYKGAVKILEKIKKHKSVNDLAFQLLGNSYDILGDPKKAIKTYDEGLKDFPESGKLYLEKGNVYWNKKEYSEALNMYEKGIYVEPTFASNYYRASILYSSSSEKVWGVLYGEIFMNMERGSKRTEDMSMYLYKTYKEAIEFTNDTSMSVSFSKNSSINISDMKDFKLPYGVGVYEPVMIMSIIGLKEINLASLNTIRTNFLNGYFGNKSNQKYPNLLFDYQKDLKEKGYLEAYNYWILNKGNEEEFERWKTENETKWNAFIEWFSENPMVVTTKNKFHSSQY